MSSATTSRLPLPNFQEQLQNANEFLSEYPQFMDKLAWRPWRLYRPEVFRKYLKFLKGNPGWDVMSQKQSNFNRAALEALSTPEEKRSEIYRVSAADYVLHELAQLLLATHPDYDFKKLAKLHDSLQKSRIRFAGKTVIGFSIAAVTFMLKDVPDEVLNRVLAVLHVDRKDYVLGTFWIGSAAVLYLLMILVPSWWTMYQAKRRHDFIGQALNYAALLAEARDSAAHRHSSQP